MNTLLVILMVLFILRIAYKYCKDYWRYGHLPGFVGVSSAPIAGHAYKLGNKPLETLFECRRRFGDVFRLDVGDTPTVFIADYDTAKDAFRQEALLGRPWDDCYIIREMRGLDPHGNLAGLVTAKGQHWREHRKFVKANLGKDDMSTIETILMEESEAACELLDDAISRQGNIVQLGKVFLPITNNAILRLLTGKRTRYDDYEANFLANCIATVFQGFAATSLFNLLNIQSSLFCK